MDNAMQYQHIIRLVSLWQEFEEQEQSQDMRRFAVWLSRAAHTSADLGKTPEDRVRNQEITGEKARKEKTQKGEMQKGETQTEGANWSARDEALHYHQRLPLNARISTLLTRMNRFATFYTKKAFAGLEMTSAQEFGVLACIRVLGTPTKTEVAYYNLLEKTTVTEILKRLIKIGLIEEFDDARDKRSKRVKITPAGEESIETAVQRLWEISEIVVGNLSDEQKRALAATLEELDQFHSDIYFHENALPLSEIIAKNVLKTSES
jgi:DNA-binding MarR family transcriptional regulator